MKTDTISLLNQLTAIAQSDLSHVTTIQKCTSNQLNYRPDPGAWSILQCLEHLNRYAAFYLSEIEKALDKNNTPATIFKGGIVGNMLVNMVVPKENGKKIKTFTAMDPADMQLEPNVIDVFIANQERLLAALAAAKNTNLNKGKIPVTFTKLLCLTTGNALRFMVHHNQRHVQQALRNV